MKVTTLLVWIPCAFGMSIPTPLDTLTSGLASICRLPFGVTVSFTSDAASNIQLKELYDVENSRDCRQVREAITELDLVVDLVIPAAQNSRCFTDSSFEYALPKDATIPRLVLENNDQEVVLNGANEILDYFETNCGHLESNEDDDDLVSQVKGAVFDIGNYASSIFRTGRGCSVSPAAKNAPRPQKPLVLYSYEGNQFCRLVREVLTELDLMYELKSCGKESPRRAELAEISGATQCPYLLDPNQNVAMPESADIIKYLYQTYATYTPPSELLQWTSEYVMSLGKPLFQATAPTLAGSNNDDDYNNRLQKAKSKLESDIAASPVVIYTYSLSPFSAETKNLLDNLGVEYTEISLGAEWIPGLIQDAPTRVALLEKTGQSSLPHVFVNGKSIGGLYSGTPGLVPALEEGTFLDMVQEAQSSEQVAALD